MGGGHIYVAESLVQLRSLSHTASYLEMEACTIASTALPPTTSAQSKYSAAAINHLPSTFRRPVNVCRRASQTLREDPFQAEPFHSSRVRLHRIFRSRGSIARCPLLGFFFTVQRKWKSQIDRYRLVLSKFYSYAVYDSVRPSSFRTSGLSLVDSPQLNPGRCACFGFQCTLTVSTGLAEFLIIKLRS